VRREFTYVTPAEALGQVIRVVHPKILNSESVQTSEMFGRVLAEDIVADTALPEHDCSQFDGFAVRAEDTHGASTDTPVVLRVRGEIRLGRGVSCKLCQGETYKVPTGGLLPKGADAVVMEEQIAQSGNSIQIYDPLRVGDNVTPKGRDVRRGKRILLRGRTLRAQDEGLLAALGVKAVQVVRRPVVPIISSGNELVGDIKEKRYGKVLQSHSHTIARLVARLGGTPVDMGIAPDDVSAIREKILEGLRIGDLLITIGGCSVGDRDYVPDAINQARNSKVIVHGIRRRPGRVSGVGVVGGKPIVMLPGHIQSTFVGFYTFAIPLIHIMSGVSEESPLSIIKARMSEEVVFNGSGEFERVVLVGFERKSGGWVARPIMGDSSLLRTLVEADGFVIAPPRKTMLERDEEVDVNLVPGLSWA